MIYFFILIFWFLISWGVTIIRILTKWDDIAKIIGGIIGVTLRFILWSWLIYKIVLIY